MKLIIVWDMKSLVSPLQYMKEEEEEEEYRRRPHKYY
jgi:hypothetical protein